jgi:hypothetical protein
MHTYLQILALFTNIAAQTKMASDVKKGLLKYDALHSHNGIVEIFDQILDNDVLYQHRPDTSDFVTRAGYLYSTAREKGPPKIAFDPNKTNLIGCDLPPGAAWAAGNHYDNLDWETGNALDI